jgi:uroporphyrinogen decarboxylase
MIFWPEVVEQWQQEGLPSGRDPGEYFGVDALRRSLTVDLSLRLPPRVMHEDDDIILRRDENGVTHREKKGSYTPPAEIDFAIKGWDEWHAFRPRMVAAEARIPPDWRARYDADRAANSLLLYKNPDPCWAVFKVLGYVPTLLKMAEDAELVTDMVGVFTDLIIGQYELLEGKGLRFDVAWFNSDICYRGGMSFSPRMYEHLLLPYHQRLTAYFAARNMPTVFHTCGDVRQLLPLYIRAGVRGIHPLEARAGNDVRDLCHLYGMQMVFIGNISVDCLSEGKEATEREIRGKVPIAKEGGAYVFHSDHSIPPTVCMENYRYALQLAQECGRIR